MKLADKKPLLDKADQCIVGTNDLAAFRARIIQIKSKKDDFYQAGLAFSPGEPNKALEGVWQKLLQETGENERPSKRQKIDDDEDDVMDKEIVAFWKALPMARTVTAHGFKFLHLAKKTSWFGWHQLHSAAMYRENHHQLVGHIDLLHKSFQGVILIGNAGIGKSIFAYLVLHQRCLNKQRTLYYKQISTVSSRAVLFDESGASFPTNRERKAVGRDTETLIVYDGIDVDKVAQPYRAKVLVISSPDTAKFKETRKLSGFARAYVGVWTEKEMKACAKHLWPSLKTKDFQDSLKLWGCIPRFVLEKNKQENDLLDDAITATDLDRLLNSVGGSHHDKDIPNKLLHLHVESDFKTRTMLIATSTIAEKVALHLLSCQKRKLLEFLGASSDQTTATGALRGAIFEGLVHAQLGSSSAKVHIRSLQKPSARTKGARL